MSFDKKPLKKLKIIVVMDQNFIISIRTIYLLFYVYKVFCAILKFSVFYHTRIEVFTSFKMF